MIAGQGGWFAQLSPLVSLQNSALAEAEIGGREAARHKPFLTGGGLGATSGACQHR